MSALPQETLRSILRYDAATGLFTRLQSRGNRAAGSKAGTLHHSGYLSITVLGETYQAHRLAWFWMTGAWPLDEIDHINGRKDDNRWANLRESNRVSNNQNKRAAYRNNAIGLLGVCVDNGKFRARIFVDGKAKHLGNFKTPQEAHTAYLAAKRRLHSGCTV